MIRDEITVTKAITKSYTQSSLQSKQDSSNENDYDYEEMPWYFNPMFLILGSVLFVLFVGIMVSCCHESHRAVRNPYYVSPKVMRNAIKSVENKQIVRVRRRNKVGGK